MTESPRTRARRVIPLLSTGAILIAVLAFTILCLNSRRANDPVPSEQTTGTAVPRKERPAAVSGTTGPVVLRPLPVGISTRAHEWTQGDVMAPEVLERIAHNPDEFVRLVEENDRIQRRQLVYRRDTAAAVVQRARATGEPVRHLTLPGLDGREIEVEVTRADLAFSGLSGTFTGHVAGKPQSLVTLAFDKGREAFTVLSPEDGSFLQGHPREPGEVLVASFDPAAYQPLQACNPILTK